MIFFTETLLQNSTFRPSPKTKAYTKAITQNNLSGLLTLMRPALCWVGVRNVALWGHEVADCFYLFDVLAPLKMKLSSISF